MYSEWNHLKWLMGTQVFLKRLHGNIYSILFLIHISVSTYRSIYNVYLIYTWDRERDACLGLTGDRAKRAQFQRQICDQVSQPIRNVTQIMLLTSLSPSFLSLIQINIYEKKYFDMKNDRFIKLTKIFIFFQKGYSYVNFKYVTASQFSVRILT